jgi:hypothetical protein
MRADGAVPLEVISDHMMYQPPAYHEQIIKHFSEGGGKRMMAAVFELVYFIAVKQNKIPI